MFDSVQSEFIESEKFESDFYFNYLRMLKEYEEKETQYLDEVLKLESSEIDYNIQDLPF